MTACTKGTEFRFEKKEKGFVFSVKEGSFCSMVKIDYLTDEGARLFFDSIKSHGVSPCQLLDVAEDAAVSVVTEIFKGDL